MTALAYALWGLFGVACVEGLEFVKAINNEKAPPWRSEGHPGLPWFVAAIVVKLGIGFGVTAATAASGQIAGPFPALAMGISAPLIIEKLAKGVPLSEATAPGNDPAPTVPAPEQPGTTALDGGVQVTGTESVGGQTRRSDGEG